MAGQIIERGKGKYLIRWFIGRDARTGKRRYGSKVVQGAKKEARRELREKLHQRDMGVVVESSRITLDQYLDDWLANGLSETVRSRTAHDYREILSRYVRPIVGLIRLDRLTPLDVRGMIRELRERGCPGLESEKSKPLSPRTVRYAHAVLHRALGQAVRWRMLATNPAEFVELPKKERREMRALTPEEAARFRAAVQGARHEALFLLLLGTGLRPSEALGLSWADVDIDAGRLALRRKLTQAHGDQGAAMDDPKTARSRRVVPIPPSVATALRSHKARQGEERLRVGAVYRADLDLVFCDDLGGPLRHRGLVFAFKAALRRAELPKEIRLYDLRHSFATLALAAGAHHKVVSDRLGHTSGQMVLDVYGHVLPAMSEEATARIEAAVFGTVPAR